MKSGNSIEKPNVLGLWEWQQNQRLQGNETGQNLLSFLTNLILIKKNVNPKASNINVEFSSRK